MLMVGSSNQFTEPFSHPGELERIEQEQLRYEFFDLGVDTYHEWTQEEAEERFHRIFIGTYMGQTTVADSVMQAIPEADRQVLPPSKEAAERSGSLWRL